MIKMTVDLSDVIDELENIQEKASESLHWATWQGVKILREEAELRAPRSKKSHYFYSTSMGGQPIVFRKGKRKGMSGSKYLFQPGDLKKSVYVVRDKEKRIQGEYEEYSVSYRKRSSEKGYVPYGSMVHFGTKRGQIANPFIQTAYDAVKVNVENTIIKTIKDAVHGKGNYQSD